MNLGRLVRTVVHLRPIQVWNRLGRKLPCRPVARTPLPVRAGVRPRTPWPSFYPCWDGAETFTFLNETHRVSSAADWNNPAWKKLWLYNLHYFDCLRQPGDAREALIARWIAENPIGAGNGWEPYPISLRVVNWIKFLLDSNQLPTTSTPTTNCLASLATQVRHLEKRLEYHLLANHLLANAKALVFAGTFFEGPEAARWLRKGLAIYRRELAEQVLADGVHFERSAMYHAILLEDVLDCLNLTGNAALFGPTAARMLGALDVLTGSDGSFVKFNDAADGIAQPPDVLRAYAAALGVTAAHAAEDGASASGFVRLRADGWTLIAKAGAIGPDYQPGHAHADSLSFELWKDGEKILTDTGTDRYVVDAERRRQRGTAAHNTVAIDGRDSSETWGGHRVGRRARTQIEEIGSAHLVAHHDGYAPLVHRRTLSLAADGVTGVDEISGGSAHEVAVYFHFEPGAENRMTLTANYPITWETRPIARAFGCLVDAPCAVVKVAPSWENRSNLFSQVRIEWKVEVKK